MQRAVMAIAAAKARVKEAEVWLATLKPEMDGPKAEIHAAKKEKRDAGKLTLEGQLKQLELVEVYLKKTKDICDAELDLAKTQKDLVNARPPVSCCRPRGA